MKSSPILYSAPMVTAIRENRKTQTRRIIHPQPPQGTSHTLIHERNHDSVSYFTADTTCLGTAKCPYGTVGDQLWGKETFFDVSDHRTDQKFAAVAGNYIYRADYAYRDKDRKIIGHHHWKPSIFMPSIASRIRQQLTEVRVQRLQDISREDAIAEGIESTEQDGETWLKIYDSKDGERTLMARKSYQSLWNSINLKPSPVYSRDPETGAKYISAYESYPWSLDDFQKAYPRAILADPHGDKPQTYHGKPLTIIANPYVWALTFTNL